MDSEADILGQALAEFKRSLNIQPPTVRSDPPRPVMTTTEVTFHTYGFTPMPEPPPSEPPPNQAQPGSIDCIVYLLYVGDGDIGTAFSASITFYTDGTWAITDGPEYCSYPGPGPESPPVSGAQVNENGSCFTGTPTLSYLGQPSVPYPPDVNSFTVNPDGSITVQMQGTCGDGTVDHSFTLTFP